MRPLRLSEIAAWCGGELLGEDRTITAIGNDSRTAAAGSLYVALPGERFDGHAFCADAAAAGASGLLVARPVDSDLPQVCCADTTRALADIATALARTRTGRIAAVTGSNGKTTVKTLIAAILECAAPGRSHANPGNRNNEIGLPLAVIAAPEDARYSVYEMGAGKPGDIAYLAAIVQPSVALVNNIGPAHLERLGSLLGVAETKGAIHAALAADGVAVINADDAFAPWFRQRIGTRVRVLDFGLDGNAEVRAEAVRPDAGGWRFRLRLADAVAEAHLAMPGPPQPRQCPGGSGSRPCLRIRHRDRGRRPGGCPGGAWTAGRASAVGSAVPDRRQLQRQSGFGRGRHRGVARLA